VWEVLKDAGIDPAFQRTSTTWATFLRSQAQAIIAADFFETTALTGTRLNVLAVVEHATRRVRVLGATAHSTAAWVTQTARNLLMDLDDTRLQITYLIRDRDGRYPHGSTPSSPTPAPGACSAGPDAPDGFDHGAVDPVLPPRTARRDADLEPDAPAMGITGVRTALQLRPPPRIRSCSLSCTDEVFGIRKVQSTAASTTC
jgi:hypothetical protein